jgi:cytoskeletal protein CcmA (bactofilin family)
MSKGPTGEGQMNTLVGNGTIFEGRLTVSSSMRVDGKIKGEVNCSDTLLVGKTGVVEASVKVRSATIGGKVNGDIEAQEVVVLEGKSELSGDIVTKKLIIEEGAVFNGTCRMGGEAGTSGKSARTEQKPDLGRREGSSSPVPMSAESGGR